MRTSCELNANSTGFGSALPYLEWPFDGGSEKQPPNISQHYAYAVLTHNVELYKNVRKARR